MSKNLHDKIVNSATPDDYLELQNPREEATYSQYYKDLDCEKLLHMYEYSNGSIYGKILGNTKGLEQHSVKQERVDLIRKSKLKAPLFRKINSEGLLRDEATNIPIQHLEKFGFCSANKDKAKKLSLPKAYLRSDLSKNKLIRGKLTLNSKTFQVHYDMDETDYEFLVWINEVLHKERQKISMDQFEIIITFFEARLYNIERILPPTIKNRSVIDYQQQQNALLYGSDDGTGCENQEEQGCAVCNISDCDSTNSIVFCDGCDIAVHQDCYGVSFIPEGPWLCRRCLIARNVKEPCLFCPSTTGAFKQTDSGDWAHVLCAMWTPELYFANPIYMEPVEGVKNIPKSRWKLICYICKQKVGACIQCSKSSCFAAYHVTCAKRAGFYMRYRKGLKHAVNDKSSMVSYCDKHTPVEWGMNHDIKGGIEKTRLYFHDKNRKDLETNIYDSNLTFITKEEDIELKHTHSERFKWRLDSSVYVIPQIILKQLARFFTDNKLPSISNEILCQIAKYYTLKRQYLGKPLIKHPDILNHASLTAETLHSRREAVEYFTKDVRNLQEMGKLTLKRSSLEKELVESKLDSSMMIFDPKTYILKSMVSFFMQHFKEDSESYLPSNIPKYAVKPSIYHIIDKIELGEYLDLGSLITDLERFSDWLIPLNLKSISPLMPLQKLFKIWQRYKKSKYATAAEQFQHIDELSNLRSEFIPGVGLELKLPPPDAEEPTNIVKKIRKKNTSNRLGIDITQFDQTQTSEGGRTLRSRRTASPNAEKTSNKLRARLDRVKRRTHAQTLRAVPGTRRK